MLQRSIKVTYFLKSILHDLFLTITNSLLNQGLVLNDSFLHVKVSSLINKFLLAGVHTKCLLGCLNVFIQTVKHFQL